MCNNKKTNRVGASVSVGGEFGIVRTLESDRALVVFAGATRWVGLAELCPASAAEIAAASVELHRWEAWSGLKAPFTLLGHHESTYVACQGAPVQPGDTCDICGQGIRYVARFRDAAGVEFVTGLDCAQKSDSTRTVSQANSIRNQIRAEQNRKRTAEQTAAAAAEFRAVREIADTLPHPRGFADRETGNPLTLADYVDWFAKNAGASGYLAALKFAVKLCREAVAA